MFSFTSAAEKQLVIYIKQGTARYIHCKRIMGQWVSSVFILSVCVNRLQSTFWPRDLVFGLSDPWHMRKKRSFFSFSKFWFFSFFKRRFYYFFPCITIAHFCCQATFQFQGSIFLFKHFLNITILCWLLRYPWHATYHFRLFFQQLQWK